MSISHQELEAFLRLHGDALQVWEIDVIDRMESERLALLNESAEDRNKPKVSARAMTPQLFDAMFG